MKLMPSRKKLTTQPSATRHAGGPIKNTIALTFVGDAMVAMIWPRRQVGLWRRWPRWPEGYRRLSSAVERRPYLVRMTAVAELAAALWWTERIYRRHGV